MSKYAEIIEDRKKRQKYWVRSLAQPVIVQAITIFLVGREIVLFSSHYLSCPPIHAIPKAGHSAHDSAHMVSLAWFVCYICWV